MEASNVLGQISPCNTQKPYIFISYSSNDKDLVWPDVLEYQNMGYNVWLDEKNLDKTKASWKEDALTAIEDMYCMLVVFYVSKSSLLSDACYRELSKTTDEFTTALHYGPVKFIAIDVDEIGNIMDFSRELHQSVFNDSSLSKEEKSKKLLTLHHFIKDFFDSNNEKVRVHPLKEINRKIDYYEEVVASFPEEARNRPIVQKQAEETEKPENQAYTQMAEKLSKEEEARKKAEQEAEQLKQELAKIAKAAEEKKAPEAPKTIEPAKAQKEPKATTPKKAEPTTPKNKQASNNTAKKPLPPRAVERAIAHANLQPHFDHLTIFSPAEIGEDRVKKAMKSYAKSLKVEDVIGIIDTTMFRSAKEGFIFTKNSIFSNSFKGEIPLENVVSYDIVENSYSITIKYENNTTWRYFMTDHQQKLILPFLDKIIELKK